MVSKTNEQALEIAIEKALTGTSVEELNDLLQEAPPAYIAIHHGYRVGMPANFNAQYALDEHYFWQFLEATQAVELAKLKKHNPVDWQRKLLERYDRLIQKHGVLHLLKKGLSVDNAFFHLLYP